ncbi:MAG TPA: pilus assembly protein TadG-related protein [Anaerolineaceae bacterium]|jgi:Flp pilus assembly protein TadG
MKIHRSQSENGQAIVLLVVGMIGLLAFAALAVDGGMVWYDRRSAQNAADAAALAGGYELARNPWRSSSALAAAIQSAAQQRAGDNHFGTSDGKIVTIHYPPSAADIHLAPGDADVNHYVQVQIVSTVSTSFLHLFFSGPVQNQVEAVAHVTPPSKAPAFQGSGLVALAPHGCGMLFLNGNLNANLVGGGIFVNSDGTCAVDGASQAKFVYTPTITVVGNISNKVSPSNLIVAPGPANTGAADSALPYPPGIDMGGAPSCSGNASRSVKNQNHIAADGTTYQYKYEMTPGSWTAAFPNGDIWLTPGIYCFSNGIDLNNNQHLGGTGVLIYLTGSNPCKFTWNGGAVIKLKAYADDPYKGLLMYVNPRTYSSTSEGPMTFNGTSDSLINGTIFAPSCSAKMNGTGGNFYRGQVIAYDITLVGGASLNMQYVSADNYQEQTPAKEDLTQ